MISDGTIDDGPRGCGPARASHARSPRIQDLRLAQRFCRGGAGPSRDAFGPGATTESGEAEVLPGQTAVLIAEYPSKRSWPSSAVFYSGSSRLLCAIIALVGWLRGTPTSSTVMVPTESASGSLSREASGAEGAAPRKGLWSLTLIEAMALPGGRRSARAVRLHPLRMAPGSRRPDDRTFCEGAAMRVVEVMPGGVQTVPPGMPAAARVRADAPEAYSPWS